MNKTNVTGTGTTGLESTAFRNFISGPAGPGGLFWRVNGDNKKLEFLNEVEIPGLSGHGVVQMLLQNLVHAQGMVAKEDFFRYKLFVKAVRERKEASVIFRFQQKDHPGDRRWLKIGGSPLGGDSSDYWGYIRDITDEVDFINHLLEKDIQRQTMIESEDLPVLLVDMKSRAIVSRNTFAYNFFGYTYHEFNEMKFQDIFPPDQDSLVPKIYETCLMEGHWGGKIPLLKKGDSVVDARIKIKRLPLKERNLLKISIHGIYEATSDAENLSGESLPNKELFQQSLLAAMEDKYDIAEVLETLMVHGWGELRVDALMYVNVQLKKQKVEVYAHGKPVADMKPGETYDYEGTISQEIRDNQLDFLVLEDTLESTKPIDWALFIPYGIRSYFVKPFFRGTRLTMLLIFCALEPNVFSEDEQDIYELYYPAFLKGVKNLRKKKPKAS